MVKLAEWDGLSYYMVKEENPTNHMVLVQDEQGKKAIYNLESGQEISNALPGENRVKAKKIIQEFRDDFLRYWSDLKAPMSS